jgi:hypothetical protein
MSKAVGLNLAALECFEQLTGKKYTEIDSVISNVKEASLSDMILLVVSSNMEASTHTVTWRRYKRL